MSIWFKRKTYGWGWTPSSWQGWLVVIAYVFLLYFLSLRIDSFTTLEEIYIEFIVPILIATVALIRISYIKGERPRWQWGESKSKKVEPQKRKVTKKRAVRKSK